MDETSLLGIYEYEPKKGDGGGQSLSVHLCHSVKTRTYNKYDDGDSEYQIYDLSREDALPLPHLKLQGVGVEDLDDASGSAPQLASHHDHLGNWGGWRADGDNVSLSLRPGRLTTSVHHHLTTRQRGEHAIVHVVAGRGE